jgi:Holliday junction resolvasome RuvABC endonuclease subunit
MKKIKKTKWKSPPGQVKLKSKAVKQMKLTLLSAKLRKLNKIIWGLDMSVLSPGLVKIDPVLKMLQFYYIRTRDIEQEAEIMIENTESIFYKWKIKIEVIEPPSQEEMEKIGTFQRSNRIFTVVSLLSNCIKEPNQIVAIEDYAYKKHAETNTNATLLAEAGGCLRQSLSLSKHSIYEISLTANKKLFSGSGAADKEKMFDAYKNILKLPDFTKLIGLLKDYKSVKKPVEDIIDALAVALSCIYLHF